VQILSRYFSQERTKKDKRDPDIGPGRKEIEQRKMITAGNIDLVGITKSCERPKIL